LSKTAIAEFRSAVRQALGTAEANGVPVATQIVLLVSEVGSLAAGWASEDDFEAVVGNLQAAVAHAARTAQDEARYQQAVERFVENWLN